MGTGGFASQDRKITEEFMENAIDKIRYESTSQTRRLGTSNEEGHGNNFLPRYHEFNP